MIRTLVVDDIKSNCDLISIFLVEMSDTDVAYNVKDAMVLYDKSIIMNKYDIILLDIQMPEIDGLQFLNYIRKKEEQEGIVKGKGVAVIMITAYDRPFVEAFETGADDYILKPVDPSNLIKKINEILNLN